MGCDPDQVLMPQTGGFPKLGGAFLGVRRMAVFWGPYWGSPGFGKLPNLNSSPHLGGNRKQPSFQDPSYKGSKESSLGNSQSSGLNDLKDWWSAGGHPRQWEGSRQVFRAGDYTLYPFGRQGYYGGCLCLIMEN